MNQTTSQTSSPTAETILKGLAKGIWRKDANPGKAPIPTIEDLLPLPPEHFRVDAPGFRDIFNFLETLYHSLLNEEKNLNIEAFEGFDYIFKENALPFARLLECTATLQQDATRNEASDENIRLIEYAIEFLHRLYQYAIKHLDTLNEVCDNKITPLTHPLEPGIRLWQQEQIHRTIKTATVDHVRNLTTMPYAVSEVNRRKWEIVGSVDAIEVDGEPIITQISGLPGPFSDDYPDRAKVYKPKGTQGVLMPMPKQRDQMDIPIALVAYQKFGQNLRSSLAPDIAQLMTLAYAANDPIILSIKEGASLLARGQDGQLGRQINPADEQRFNIAFACVHGMSGWITDARGVNQFYPLTACDRFSDDRVSIAPAAWARDRTKGGWTLTAGFGVAGQSRLKGNAHNNNVWRVITGVEYWLARERFPQKGTYQGTSQALIPTSGNTGPGNWYTLTWQELMMIAGDIWDWNDRQAYKRAHKRWQKIRDALIQHGYHVKNLNKPAEAGDTVEFLFGKDGVVMVRATERFVEGARRAKRKDWQTVNLTEFLGI